MIWLFVMMISAKLSYKTKTKWISKFADSTTKKWWDELSQSSGYKIILTRAEGMEPHSTKILPTYIIRAIYVLLFRGACQRILYVHYTYICPPWACPCMIYMGMPTHWKHGQTDVCYPYILHGHSHVTILCIGISTYNIRGITYA